MIAIERDDGGVSLLNLPDDVPDEVVEREVAKWQETFPAKATGWHRVDSADLPKDRADRDAWKFGADKKIRVDAARKAALAAQRGR